MRQLILPDVEVRSTVVTYRPLSQRENPTSSFDGPHEGLPRWMLKATQDWVRPFMQDQTGYPSEERLQALEVTLRMDPGLSWREPLSSLMTRMFEDQAFSLDVIDYVLRECEPGTEAAFNMNAILTLGGSVWEVQPVEIQGGQRCQLGQRAIGPVAEAIESVHTINERAHAHLLAAWGKLMGRNPDPSGAYREAVRAVEVVAGPVVKPGDSKEQADAAVHIAIALTRLFAGGHIRHT